MARLRADAPVMPGITPASPNAVASIKPADSPPTTWTLMPSNPV
eukprot:CAMPEP_0172858662 /NCGR_PEP_ID=MMETSP1075-20121228/67551_2 /TAXON_ID=2916 /ORGANISM="Ceratium fusus, Strain PA161109" /LENGTH=43 /DNA_ID= /DNA_START= /DNA_END= /DNA_ORIENTATION=